jgi:hypothetical protein
MSDWLAAWLACCLAAWHGCWLVGLLLGWFALHGLLLGWFAAWLGCLAWFAAWLVCCLAAWLIRPGYGVLCVHRVAAALLVVLESDLGICSAKHTTNHPANQTSKQPNNQTNRQPTNQQTQPSDNIHQQTNNMFNNNIDTKKIYISPNDDVMRNHCGNLSL